MTVIRNIPLNLKLKEILLRQGIERYSRLNPSLKELTEELLALMKREQLLQPAIVYSIYAVTECAITDCTWWAELYCEGQPSRQLWRMLGNRLL